MKLTITREQLQEGLVAVAASVPAKTTLPILSNILLEATQGRHSPLGHRSRHRGEHHGGGVGGSGGSDHAAGPQAGRDRPRAAQCRHPAHRLGRAAGDHRVRPLQVPAAGPAARGVPRLPDASSSRAAGGRRPRICRSSSPTWPSRPAPRRAGPSSTACSGSSGPSGCGWWPPTGTGSRGWTCPRPPSGSRRPGRPDRAAQGAGADPPALRADEDESRSPGARTTSASAPPRPRSSPG